MKKIVSLFFSVILIMLLCIPYVGYADGGVWWFYYNDFEYEIWASESEIYLANIRYVGNDTDVVVPSSVPLHYVTSEQCQWKFDAVDDVTMNNIKNLATDSIPVKHIYAYLGPYFEKEQSVNSVKIMDNMSIDFNLKYEVTDGITTWIPVDPFVNCTNIKVIGATEEAYQTAEKYNFTWIRQNEEPIKVIVKETVVRFDQAPVLQSGRTLVPVRAIFEALGASVDWNAETRTVTSERDDTKISLAIDSDQLYVNGSAKTIDVPAQIIGDRTMVPARAIAEAFGCDVQWDAENRTVIITE